MDVHGLLGPTPATLSEARTYWACCVAAAWLSIIIHGYLGWRYATDTIFQDPTIRVFIPTLIGNLLFAITYGIHHAYNLIEGDHYFDDGHSMHDSGMWCDITFLGTCGIFMQMFGQVFIAWCPYHLIRSGQRLQPTRITTRLISFVSITGFSLAVLVCGLQRLTWGKGEYRHLRCVAWSYDHWEHMLPACIFFAACFLCIMILYWRATVEMTLLIAKANSQHLSAQSTSVRNFGILLLGNLCFWCSPGIINALLEGMGWRTPVEVAIIVGLLFEYNSVGTAMIIWLHVRSLTRVLERRRKRHLSVKLSKSKEDVDQEPIDTQDLINRGVSIHFLHAFIKKYDIQSDVTTAEVMKYIIMAVTKLRQCPYVDTILDLQDQEGRSAVGRAKVFVSHCWAGSFVALVKQLTHFYFQLGETDTVYVWLDVFAINQHHAEMELPNLHQVIYQVDALVLSLDPWDAPQALTRVWCLWELLKAVQGGTQIRPVMPRTEEAAFLETVRTDHGKIATVLNNICVKNASATKEADKDVIFLEISQTVGFDRMNEMIRSQLQICLQGIAVDKSLTGLVDESMQIDAQMSAQGFGIVQWCEQRSMPSESSDDSYDLDLTSSAW